MSNRHSRTIPALTRRSFLKRIGSCAATIPVASRLSAQTQAKPNILLIFVDDMGYGDPGCYGGTSIPTPNIDRLAAEGVRCTDGYVTAPLCAPSRCGIMAGAYNQRFGMQNNPDQWPKHPYVIPPEHKLMPEALAAAGYVTAHIGKWNTTRDVHATFSEVHDVMDWKGNYYPDDKGEFRGVDGGGPKTWPWIEPHGWGPPTPGAPYLTDRLTDHAIDFIGRHRAKPFFLYLSYNAPHTPLQADKAYDARFAGLRDEPNRIYAGMVASLDANMGRVLGTLDSLGLTGNTLVAFVSDNGPARGGSYIKGWHKDWPEGTVLGSAGPLNGNKAKMLEGGIRVPFILRWPGKLEAGSVYRRPVSSMDLYPTFCAASGTPLPTGTRLDGVDLMPFLRGKRDSDPHDILFWKMGTVGAARQGDWKLVVQHWKPRLQLFNLADDVGETHELSAANPDETQALHKAWLEWSDTLPEPASAKAK